MPAAPIDTTPGVSLDETVATHADTLTAAAEALATRSGYSRYPDSPSPRVHGQDAAVDGEAAWRALHDAAMSDLAGPDLAGPDVPVRAGSEVSPFGPVTGVRYPHLGVAEAVDRAAAALPGWRDLGHEVRAAVCIEVLDAVAARPFELAHAVQHTSGQPFVMAFQAGGAHALDRGLEAVVATLVQMRQVPPTARREIRGRAGTTTVESDHHLVPRGIAAVIGCNTFPTWNALPGLFASLVGGNPVVVKPHPRAVLPLAIVVQCARRVLARHGLNPDVVTLLAETDGQALAADLAVHPAVRVIDYTGGPAFGEWLQRNATGATVHTEQSGVNAVVVDSTDDLAGLLRNLAFSLTLYSGQMCTSPQTIWLARDGVRTDEGLLTPEDFAQRLASAVVELTGDDAKAVELLGATVNDAVRERAADVAALVPGSTVVLDSRRIVHPDWPDAVVRAPALVAVDLADESAGNQDGDGAWQQECFGPVGFVVTAASLTDAVNRWAATVRARGAMTATVHSTSTDVLDTVRAAAVDAGVTLSENLTGTVFVNQTAAFADYHGTGANPAANSAYTDAAFVASRYRVVTTRRVHRA